MLDKTLFASNMRALEEVYGKPVSKELLQIYYRVLKDMTDEQFMQAVESVISSHVWSTFPKPAEFIQAIQGDSDAVVIKELVWVEHAMRKQGSYDTIMFRDPITNSIVERVEYGGLRGWPALCAMPIDECKWWKKDFEKMYKALIGTDVGESRPLVGLHNSPDVILIGGEGDRAQIENKANTDEPRKPETQKELVKVDTEELSRIIQEGK
jgi:hypothetical protein